MKLSWYIPACLFATMAALFACNSKGPLPSPDANPPTVSFTIPANGSVNNPVNLSGITITFSEAMERSTINDKTITLVDSGVTGSIPCSVTVTDQAGKTVELLPSVGLNPTTLYRIEVSTGVKDKFGNAMGAPFTASFYTSAAADTTPPVIATSYPATGATGVPVNSSPRVTFSEPVIPQTIDFVLTRGTTTIPGTVSYNGTTAVFTPTNILDDNVLYTARIAGGENGVRDLAGNSMLADHTWSFTTVQDTTPPTVTATTPAAGGSNVGVNSAISVTFSEPIDQTSIVFSLSAGGVPVNDISLTYNGTTAIFTPPSILAYSTQYQATVSAGLRDLAGNATAADHVWTFTTGKAPDTKPPSVTATSPGAGSPNVGVDTAITVTFSEPVDQTTIQFDLSAGGIPVTGRLTYSGTTAVFTPAGLNYSTLYTGKVSAGVLDLAGNAMSNEYSWSFTTSTAPDITPPTVTATTPAAGGDNVGVNAAISVTFSEPVDQTTILFDLTGVPAADISLTYSGTTAVFTPAGLNYSTLYTGKVSAGVLDLAGNPMSNDYSWSFTTTTAPDIAPPIVTATTPAAGEGNVAVDTAISVTFSEPVDQTTILFDLSAGGVPATGSLTYSGTTAVFTPSEPLNYSTVYNSKVSAGVQDLAGNPMSADHVWTFTTSPDTTPPVVVATIPGNGVIHVEPNGALSATFSEPVDPATIVFRLTDGTTDVPCSTTYNGTTATFTLPSDLIKTTTYTATVVAGVLDLAGNAMIADSVWTFTTK